MSVQQETTPTAVQPARRTAAPRSEWAKARERLGWILITPTIVVIMVVAFYPLIRVLYLSLTNARLGSINAPRFLGFANYAITFRDPTFLTALNHTVVFTVLTVALETVFGLGIALIIHSNFRGRGAVRAAMLIPWAIPTVVSSRMWAFMFNDVFGVINDLLFTRLHLLSHKVAWIANPATALPAVIAVDVWKTTPFMALLLLAGLQVIPGDIYEAATVDGASKLQQFWTMTLPLLRPALMVALIFRTMDAFRVFDMPFVIKGTAPETITLGIYARQQLVDFQKLGQGSAISVIIFLFIVVFVVIYTWLLRSEEA